MSSLSVSSTKMFSGVTKAMNSVCTSVGKKISSAKSDKFERAFKHFEPTGVNNTFLALAFLMGFMLIPRVGAALKRNPDDKEATMDEVQEILFRDIQSVLIILFALNAINAVIAGKASKSMGLPLTNKPYTQVFDTDKKGIKSLGTKLGEFASHPIEKIKRIGRNIIDTINPTGGVVALSNEQFVSKYSGYKSVPEISKMFAQIKNEKGNPDKVFDGVMDILIQNQTKAIETAKKQNIAGFNNDLTNSQEILENLQQLKKAGLRQLSTNLDPRVQEQLGEFFMDRDNALVQKATGVNALLRTGALLFNIAYLGFGLPALNEKRLEKKYLKDNPDYMKHAQNEQNVKVSNTLINKSIKAQEVKLFSNFIK